MSRKTHDPVNDFVRARVKAVRLKRGLSTRQLAALAGIPEGSYCCLEGGFYRISLSNLQRIVTALGIGIEDVWPQQQRGTSTVLRASESDVIDVATMNRFRFHEVCRLSESSRGALLSRHEGASWRLVQGWGVGEGARAEQLLEQEAASEAWQSFQRRENGTHVVLLLKSPSLDDRLKSLIELYLDLWTAIEAARP